MTTEEETASIRRDWAAATTHRERAEIEERAWREFGQGKLKGAPCDVIVEVLKMPRLRYEITARRALYTAGPVAAPLWERVDDTADPWSTVTAVRLLRDARKRAKDGAPLAVALGDVLRAYDAIDLSKVYNGRRVKIRPKDWGEHLEQPVITTDGFWKQLRELTRAYVEERLKLSDEPTKESFRRELETGLRALIVSLQDRIHNLERRGAEGGLSRVSRPQVVRACSILVVDPPRVGKPADLKAANRNKRRLLKGLHPDIVGPGQEAEFQAVCEAYALLERYTAEVGAERHVSSVNGSAEGAEL